MASTSSTNSVMVPAQIDFYMRKVNAPKYKMLRIPMNNNTNGEVKIGATDSLPIEFKLPGSKVYNLARSYLSYVKTIPAGAAGTANWFYNDIFDLGNAITFGSAGGNDLVNLQYAQNFSKIKRKLHTSTDEFLSGTQLSGLERATTKALNYVPGGNNANVPLDYLANNDYMEAKYASTVSALNASLGAARHYPLSAFNGTLLGVDRDFYSPVEQYLRITAGTGMKTAFTTTTVGVPIVGADNITNQITFSGIYLYLAVEENMDIVASMMESYAKGQLKFSIPYTTGFKTAGSGAGMQTNISVTLTRQYGKRLKRVLHSVFNPIESKNTAYDHDNHDGRKILNYQTYLDNTPLQDRILSCLAPTVSTVNSDDYTENKKFIGKQSAILGWQQYTLNWFHMDQFFEPHDLSEGSLPEVNLDEGILMDSDKQWLFSGASVAANQIHYTWAEFTREILMTPDGAHFV